MRIAINGFGRIGRAVFRIIESMPDMEVVAINDLFDTAALRYQLQYDTVMGPFEGGVEWVQDEIVTRHTRARMYQERDPGGLPWRELGIDAVVESTGIFRKREQLQRHLDAGAKRVLLTVPSADKIDYTVVLGVNDQGLKPDHHLVSNASCTTNCLAPLVKVLHQAFGLHEGVINTVHAYTNDQSLADVPHADWRRSRAAAENIIPTSTGAAKAVGEVLPELNGKLDGIASRVPVPDGSVVDLYAELKTLTTTQGLNEEVRLAAETNAFAEVLQYSTEPIVSSDIIGNPHSSIFDASFTQVIQGRYVKVLSWYDNEWGYANRVCDVLKRFAAFST